LFYSFNPKYQPTTPTSTSFYCSTIFW